MLSRYIKCQTLTSLDTDSQRWELFEVVLTGNQEAASILAMAFVPLSKLNSLIDSYIFIIN